MSQGGNEKRLTLPDRINKLGASHVAAELLHIVKWLGDAGSHGKALSKDAVLDSFVVFDHFLNEEFSGRQKIANEATSRLKRLRNQAEGKRK